MELREGLNSAIESWIAGLSLAIREEEGVITEGEWEDEEFI